MVGLSRGHISPCVFCTGEITGLLPVPTYQLELARGGRLVRVTASSGVPAGPRQWQRGAVSGLSRQSRGRLLRLVNSIDVDHLQRRPIFLTLTYPRDYPAAPARYKRDLDVLWKRIKRGWKQRDRHGRLVFVKPEQPCAIWRLEEQKRGAPHFHLIIFGINYIDRHWISRAWYEVVGGKDARHLRVGTRVEYPDYWEKAGSYVAKYIAKQAERKEAPKVDAGPAEHSWEAFHNYGRAWGVLGRANLPTNVEEYDLPEWAFVVIKSAIAEARADERVEEWIAAPYRGIWGTCGPGVADPVLRDAGLLGGDGT